MKKSRKIARKNTRKNMRKNTRKNTRKVKKEKYKKIQKRKLTKYRQKGRTRRQPKYHGIGGGWPWSKNEDSAPPPQIAPPPQTALFQGREDLFKNQQNVENAIKVVKGVGAVSAVGYGIASALASTGIGLPVAGVIAGTLLLINTLLKIYQSNLRLRLLLQDAFYIIMDCYLIYDLIVKSYEILNTHNDPNSNCANVEPIANERVYAINETMKTQLNHKIEELINALLQLCDTPTINILRGDRELSGAGFDKLLQEEMDKRNKESRFFSIRKFDRKITRTMGSAKQSSIIITHLTVINSYIILLKSNLDLILQKFLILSPTDYNTIWNEIICSKEYNAYIKPNPKQVLDAAKEDAGTVDPNQLSAGVIDVSVANDENEDNPPEYQEGQPPSPEYTNVQQVPPPAYTGDQ
jgi:hypothetical protein